MPNISFDLNVAPNISFEVKPLPAISFDSNVLPNISFEAKPFPSINFVCVEGRGAGGGD